QSANRSRGGDVPPGSAGKPRARRSGAGGGRSEPVRDARCGRPQPVSASVEAVRANPLESGLRSTDLRAVRRRAVGKGPPIGTSLASSRNRRAVPSNGARGMLARGCPWSVRTLVMMFTADRLQDAWNELGYWVRTGEPVFRK